MDVRLLQPLSTNQLTIPGLKLTPNWYSHSAIGGPHQADLTGEGKEFALMSAISAVGAGVEIYSDFSDRVWWGQLYKTTLKLGAVTIKTSLDNLRNKIKVLFTTLDPITGESSGQLETAWEYDTESILRYGLREFIYTSDAITETEATTQRHNLLLAMKDPKPVIVTSSGTSGSGKASLQVRCRGWFDTLDYRYYQSSAGAAGEYGFQDTGEGIFRFGMATTYQKAAMSFQVGASDDYKYVSVALSKTAPTDTVVCKLYSDSSSAPNTLLGTSEAIAATALTTDVWTWIKFTFTTVVALTAATTYWIVLERTGSLSDTNFYTVDSNIAGTYASGTMKYHNGSAWVAPTTAQDMLFLIAINSIPADADTTAVIEAMVEAVTSTAEVNTVEIVDTSGVTSYASNDGNSTIKSEVVRLLEIGSSNYRRMLARVLPNKRLEIREEPAATASGWIDRAGVLHDLYGAPMRPETCPVAMWVNIKGVMPVGAAFGQISPETCFFIEECEYNVKDKTVKISPRDSAGMTNYMAVGNG